MESLVRRPVERIALIHPGSGGRNKCWELDGFLRLAAALEDLGVGVVFVTGPVELDVLGDSLPQVLGGRPTIAGVSLTEVTALCAAADLCIGNDSGFSHLAAAASDCIVLVIFGRTDPAVWRPLGERVRVLGGLGRWPSFEEVLTRARDDSAFQVPAQRRGRREHD
jgi:ADP-heptose:LPS heptosyltransferase